MYNNVPCVGHAHPRVARAVAAQAKKINVNMRYLHHGAVTLAERLIRSKLTALCTSGLRPHALLVEGLIHL